MSRSTVCRELGIEERRYRTIISRLQKSGEIIVDTSGPSTLITIVNWERYQADYIEEADEHRPAIDQVSTNERPSDNCADMNVNSSCSINTERSQSVQTSSADQVDDANNLSPSLDLFFESDHSAKEATSSKKKTEVSYEFIVKLYHNLCPDLPKVIKITDKRKTRIRLWYEDIGASYERVQEIFERCSASRFLKGDNNRGWKADFDWIINKTNWVKILEGRYDDVRPNNQSVNYDPQPQDRYAKRRGADSAARSAEDYTDTI